MSGEPGLLALFQSVFYAAGIKQTDAAEASGYTEKHVSQMLHGKAGTLTAWDSLIRAALALHHAGLIERAERAEAALEAAERERGEWRDEAQVYATGVLRAEAENQRLRDDIAALADEWTARAVARGDAGPDTSAHAACDLRALLHDPTDERETP